jgi:hypothetical protein
MESNAVKNITEHFQIRLRRIEERIAKAEGDGLRARWEFGYELLMQRVGEKLPPGLLNQVCADVGVSRAEVKFRVRFADKFPDEKSLANALANWPTWFQMTQEGLMENRKKPLRARATIIKREQARRRIYELIDEHKGKAFTALEWRNRIHSDDSKCLSVIPWVNVVWSDNNKVQINVDEDLRAICDGRIARPELHGFSIGAFLRHMRTEIARRRKENHEKDRVWRPEAINSLEQKRILDWIETEIDRVPDLPSPKIRDEHAPKI